MLIHENKGKELDSTRKSENVKFNNKLSLRFTRKKHKHKARYNRPEKTMTQEINQIENKGKKS